MWVVGATFNAILRTYFRIANEVKLDSTPDDMVVCLMTAILGRGDKDPCYFAFVFVLHSFMYHWNLSENESYGTALYVY